MTPPLLIGLTGRAGTGKDTVAIQLRDIASTRRAAFADALKAAAYASNPLVELAPYGDVRRLQYVVDAVGWDVAKMRYADVRAYLQSYGVAMREALPGCWIDIVMNKVERLRSAGHSVVVTDVRFPDEVQAIRNAGGTVVRLTRQAAPDLGANAAHPSEALVDTLEVDFEVANDHSPTAAAYSTLIGARRRAVAA